MHGIMRRIFLVFLLCALWLMPSSSPLEARRVRSHVKPYVEKGDKKMERKGIRVVPDSVTAAQLHVSGYDHIASSDKESFFLTNGTDRLYEGIELEIEYLSPTGRQLHRRTQYLPAYRIPKPGETLRIEIRSWDSQHTFYYEKSTPPRGGGVPYKVKIDVSAIYLSEE